MVGSLLHTVVQQDKIDWVKDLVRKGADVNAKGEYDYTPSHWAAHLRREQIFGFLLSSGADVGARDEDGYTPLHIAVKSRNESIVKRLLIHGSNVNVRKKNGLTPFDMAVGSESVSIFRMLMDRNADKKLGTSALHDSVRQGDHTRVSWLLNAGVDPDSGDKNLVSPLQLAVEVQNTDIVKLLLERGAKVNCVGSGPLHAAAKAENLKIMRLLLDKGADVDAKCEFGYTPLHWAAYKSKSLVVPKTLIDAGANVNAKASHKSYTPLHVATQTAKAWDILNLVSSAEAPDTGTRKNLKNPSQEAAMNWNNLNVLKQLFGYDKLESLNECDVQKIANVDVMKLLLNSEADVNGKDEDGHVPLHVSADFGHTSVLKLLVNFGACVNAKSKNGNAALHYAVFENNVENAKFLISVGANVNLKNDSMETPLLMATFKDMSIIKILINAGANANEPTRDGDHVPLTYFINSLRLASETRTTEILRLLVERTDVNVKAVRDQRNILVNTLEAYRLSTRKTVLFKIILEHIAKLKTLNLHVDSRLADFISLMGYLDDYFRFCTLELKKAMSTKIDNCCVTFFNILVDDKYKRIKYAGNEELKKNFKNSVGLFPIYRPWMLSNMAEGIEGPVNHSTLLR